MNKAVFRIPLHKIKITGKSFLARNVFCGIKEEIVLPKKMDHISSIKTGPSGVEYCVVLPSTCLRLISIIIIKPCF